jgi:hypothetical protein
MRQLNLDESETTYQMFSTIGWAIFIETFQGFLRDLDEEIDSLSSIQLFLEREQYLGARKHLRDFIKKFETEITEQAIQQRRKSDEQSTARFGS